MTEGFSWADYGLAGITLGACLTVLLTVAKAGRADLNRITERFIRYMETEGKENVAALRSVADKMQMHDTSAERRHREIVRTLLEIQRSMPGETPDAPTPLRQGHIRAARGGGGDRTPPSQ